MKSPIRLFATAATAVAISAAQAQVLSLDPFARRETARQEAARNPIAKPHLDRVMAARAEFRLDNYHTFQVINANQDDLGWTHVRLQQYYGGVKVLHGTVISHVDPNGLYTYTDSIKRNINIGLTPAVSQTAALDLIARHPTHLGPYDSQPKVELIIDPVTELVNPLASNGALQPSMDALPYARAVKEYRLAYEIRTIEKTTQPGQGVNAWVYRIDARNGELIAVSPLAKSSVGVGSGNFNKQVSFITNTSAFGFQMLDIGRNYGTFDADVPSPWLGSNIDADNNWGDGLPFQGDATASLANRQSAMVDGHFGALVYWELMNNVFNRAGPDKKKYAVNIWTHYGTNLDDAQYVSGEVHLGDGLTRQALDCLGHELGHALNDFTADMNGVEGDGLNESNSDIWGAMTTFYLGGGGYAAQSKTIPAAGGAWLSKCSNRSMTKPSDTVGVADYWYLQLLSLPDVHQRGEPNSRAFFFLSNGASAIMSDQSYSERLPAGMDGIGTHDAARIWYDAVTNWMPEDADYGLARTMCLLAALVRWQSPSSPQYKAVMNAYAGIGIGSPAPGYPVTQTVSELEPNDSWQTATPLPGRAGPIQPPLNVIAKGTQSTGGANTDWYKVTVRSGDHLSAGVAPGIMNLFPEIYQVEVFNSLLTSVGKGISTPGVFRSVDVLVGPSPVLGLPSTSPQQFYIKVDRLAGSGPGIYELAVQYR